MYSVLKMYAKRLVKKVYENKEGKKDVGGGERGWLGMWKAKDVVDR